MTQVQDCNVSAHNLLYSWNVIFPPGISQMQAFLLQQAILLKRPPFLDISAQASLPSGLESRHFEIFSCCALTQIQTRLSSINQCTTHQYSKYHALNLIIDKLPVFFSFDGDYVTSLGCTDAPVVTRIPSAFREYVRGVFETGCLALYGKKKLINKFQKMYTVDSNSDNVYTAINFN